MILLKKAILDRFQETCPSSSDFLYLDRETLGTLLNESLKLTYPNQKAFHAKKAASIEAIFEKIQNALEECFELLSISSSSVTEEYFKHLLLVCELIQKDAKAIYEGDPASNDLSEVYLSSPGLYAITTYRLAHFFYQKKIPILPRLLSEIAHEKTGIDIHPGASIGESFMIDHGTGVVIGETAVVGNNVKIYQGVTLGALSVEKSLRHKKRHPSIEDNTIIYSNATILGGNTIIGHSSIIGGNVWLTKSIEPHSIVYHKSEVELINNTNNFNQELTYEI